MIKLTKQLVQEINTKKMSNWTLNYKQQTFPVTEEC